MIFLIGNFEVSLNCMGVMKKEFSVLLLIFFLMLLEILLSFRFQLVFFFSDNKWLSSLTWVRFSLWRRACKLRYFFSIIFSIKIKNILIIHTYCISYNYVEENNGLVLCMMSWVLYA